MIPLKNLFSKNQNKAKFKNLDDSIVLSSDFPGLRSSAASMISRASVALSEFLMRAMENHLLGILIKYFLNFMQKWLTNNNGLM